VDPFLGKVVDNWDNVSLSTPEADFVAARRFIISGDLQKLPMNLLKHEEQMTALKWLIFVVRVKNATYKSHTHTLKQNKKTLHSHLHWNGWAQWRVWAPIGLGNKCDWSEHTENSNPKRFEKIELPAKLLDYFLWSNRSSIKAHTHMHTHAHTHPRTHTHNHTYTHKHKHPASHHPKHQLVRSEVRQRWSRLLWMFQPNT